MAANSPKRVTAEEVRGALIRLVEERNYSEVTFHESTSPPNSPMEDDYVVSYEAEFLPTDLEHAYLKIMVTATGQVGIGFETRQRLAQRLQVALGTRKKSFAAGRELASISTNELLDFVTVVAQGGVALQARVGLTGLGDVKAVITPDGARSIAAQNARHWNWIAVSARNVADSPNIRIVRFKTW